jgi:MOSC domain-containing protein YiiM
MGEMAGNASSVVPAETRSPAGAGFDHPQGMLGSPLEVGTVELVVCRPAAGERVVLAEGVLDVAEGLVGDRWRARGAGAGRQLTVMNARFLAMVAGPGASAERGAERWAEAGDQLYVDLDLSFANLPAGTRLALGPEAVIEVTPAPHNGCAKFTARFGAQARDAVNSPLGRALRLRGLNAHVVAGGRVRAGDPVVKLRPG